MIKLVGAMCALLLMEGPVLAATSYTGIFDANGEGQGDLALSGYPNSTDFNFYFTTSAPVISGMGQYTYEAAFDDYFDGSPTLYGGDNSPVHETFSITTSFVQTTLVTPKGYNLYYPDGNLMQRNYFYADDVSIDVFVPTSYAGYSYTFGISPVVAVPEPATWTIFMVGAALLGAATRIRRRETTEACPPSII